MTTVAEVLTWPKGAEVRDLYVRVTGAWEYKEFDSPKGKWGYLPLSVKDDSSQEYLRVEWRNPKTTDPEAIKGKRIVLSAYNGKGCNVDVYQDKHRVKVSGGCLRSDSGAEVADPTSPPSPPASQSAPASSGALPHKDWWDLYGAELDEARIYHPDDDLNARPAAISAMIAVSRGEKVRPRLSSEATAPEAPPAEDDPPPPDDEDSGLPF